MNLHKKTLFMFGFLLVFLNAYAWPTDAEFKMREENYKKIDQKRREIITKKLIEKYDNNISIIDGADIPYATEFAKYFLADMMFKGCAEPIRNGYLDLHREENIWKLKDKNISKIYSDFSDDHYRLCQELEQGINNYIAKLNNSEKASIKDFMFIGDEFMRRLKILGEKVKEKISIAKANHEADLKKSVKNDVIAQVLNYSMGVPEDGSGKYFYYQVDDKKCVYKILLNSNIIVDSMLFGGESVPLNNIASQYIDLNNIDYRNVNFYQRRILRSNEGGGNSELKFSTVLEGSPHNFICDSSVCGIDRLRRGWQIVASKCNGVKKLF